MLKVVILIAFCSASAFAQANRDEKKADPWEFFKVDSPEEHHGHNHHHHPDAHFPNGNHHHHGNEQTDHTANHQTVRTHVDTIKQRPDLLVVRTEHREPLVTVTKVKQPPIVTHSDVTSYAAHSSVHQNPHGHDHLEVRNEDHSTHNHPSHLHDADLPHKSPPGYPSSDFAKYFAKYTSRGGDPKEAAHSYYRDHAGHLYNYDVEPEYAQPRQVRIDHLKG